MQEGESSKSAYRTRERKETGGGDNGGGGGGRSGATNYAVGEEDQGDPRLTTEAGLTDRENSKE